MNKVGFIGSPGAGTVARQILNMGTCNLAIWQPGDSDDDGLDDAIDGEIVDVEQLADTPLIVVSTGINDCRKIARRLGDVITGRHIVVHTIRGVETGTLNTASTILHEETPTRRIGFVTGPMRLEDLQQGRPASAVCASHFPEVHDLIEEAMMSPGFRVYHAGDLEGAELTASYGRIIALMSGLADGLQLGASLQATLFARGLAEMSRFVGDRDGDEQTPFGLSGAGNLYADTHQQGNLDFQMGRFCAAGDGHDAEELIDEFGQPAREIVDMLAAFEEVAQSMDAKLHLLQAADVLLTARTAPDDVVRSLMSLPALEE